MATTIVPVNYKDIDLLLEVEYDYQPEEKRTFNYPGCAAEVEICDGTVSLDGTVEDLEIVAPLTEEEKVLLARIETDNEALFQEILDSKAEEIEEYLLSYEDMEEDIEDWYPRDDY